MERPEKTPTEIDFTDDQYSRLVTAYPDGFGENEEQQAIKYINNHIRAYSSTQDQAVDSLIEERKKILSDESYTGKDYTITTGAQPGAGTVEMGIKPLEEQ